MRCINKVAYQKSASWVAWKCQPIPLSIPTPVEVGLGCAKTLPPTLNLSGGNEQFFFFIPVKSNMFIGKGYFYPKHKRRVSFEP